MTKITDINGAAEQPLRSIKKPQINASFSSKLKDSKLKQTSEEIVSILLSTIKGSDEYSIQLHSKMSDVVLGRIASLKAETDVSQSDLLELKDAISSDIQKSGLSDKLKAQLQQSVSSAINSTTPSDDSSKIIDELKKLDESIDKQAAYSEEDKQLEKIPEIPADITAQDEQLKNIEDIKDAFAKLLQHMQELPNAVVGKISDSFQQLNKSIEKIANKTTPQIQKHNNFVGKQLDSVQESIEKKTESLGKSFEDVKFSTIDGIQKKQQKMQDAANKISNPIKPPEPPKKESPLKKLAPKAVEKVDDKFEKYKRTFIPQFLMSTKALANKTDEFILNTFKANTKQIHKALSKTISSMVVELVKKVASSVFKILSKLAEFLANAIYKIVSGLTKGLFAPFKPVLLAISVALGLIMAAVIMAMFKFPELVKPIAESLAKLAVLMVKVVGWLITEVWTWVSGTLWPFLKNKVWPFLKDDLWPFVESRVFPIIERVYKWVYEEFWPFLTTELWPWVMDQLTKFWNFFKTELWPFIEETLSWFRDVIITPVWDTFVVPFFSWIVEKAIPWISEHVAPVIKTILAILNEFLEAIKPWIEPLFGKMMKIIDWLLQLLQKVFKILEPGIMSVVNCIKNLFVNVFNLIKDTVLTIVEFIELLIKAFKQAWNNLCDYFADITIEVRTPSSWKILGDVRIIGPFRPFAGMASKKFDMSGSGTNTAPKDPANPEESSEEDSNALKRLDNYINSAYGRIFMYLKVLIKLLGVDVSDSPALRAVNVGFFGTAKLRKIDASKTLEKYGDNPIDKITKAIDNIAKFLDENIKDSINLLLESTGNKELAITVKADEAVKNKTADIDNSNDKNQNEVMSGFDVNEFLDELLKDDEDQELKIDEDNAFSFLANNVFPYMNDNIKPLVMRIRELADGIKPTNNSVVNILESNQQEDMNYALVDQ